MIKASAIRDKLKAAPDVPFRELGLASDFNTAVKDQLKASPALYVLPSERVAEPDAGLTGRTRQRVQPTFSVIIAVGGNGPGADQDLDKIDDLEAWVIDKLVGWQPAGLDDVIVYRRGQMVGVDLDKNAMFWGCDFASSFYLRKDIST